jgi:hypothetical protein
MKVNFGFWLILVSISLCCCKKEEISEYTIKKLYASPDGGTIETSNIKLSFLEGSVSEKTEIKVRNIDSLSEVNFADSIYFFRYLIGLTPENTAFQKPVTISISDYNYLYKAFDEDSYEIYYLVDDLKLYNIDFKSKKIFCLNDTKTDIHENTLSVQADISHTGYYAIGISKKKLDYKGGYFIATISSSDPEISDTTIRFESKSGKYSYCYLVNSLLSGTLTGIIQISQKGYNNVFQLETFASHNNIGEHKIIWNDENYIVKYTQMNGRYGYSVEISGRTFDEGIVNFTKFGGLGENVEGTLISRGTTFSNLGNHIVEVNVHFSVKRLYYE